MNDADLKIKQQIVDKIKSSTNILITVSRDPSVDDLSAALGLTALLNKLDKHATAIFSGAIPPAISFLNPDKVFENSADSLRDFIIALDKEKADHLRYKVDGDVVKIFITPYKTTITSNDLEFSQGDYNVELVLALGVANKDHLDTSLEAHGQILQDVTIVTFSAGDKFSQLGSLDWHDGSASSLSEMVANISDSLKTDKSLLDKQISTSLLTGIVAATDRFSNILTSPSTMNVAAQLMAAGADQQLISTKLRESHEINSLEGSGAVNTNTVTTNITNPIPQITAEPSVSTLPTGDLTINHQLEKAVDVPISSVATPPIKPEVVENHNIEPIVIPATTPIPVAAPAPILPPTSTIAPQIATTIPKAVAEPSLGGTLNATAEQAAEQARRDIEDQQNKTILSHSYLGGSSTSNTPINSAGQSEDSSQSVDIFSSGPMSNAPSVVDLPLPPPLPDFSTLPPPTTTATMPNIPIVTAASTISTTMPAMPSFGAPVAEPITPMTSTLPPSNANDPSQFRIPGQ
ncbi:MAG: hypothetical protein WCJ36_01225 [Candidatus Saccharibacteria bacterium]